MDVFKNAKIYTMDENMPIAGAVVTDGDKILYAGTEEVLRIASILRGSF